MPSMEYVILIVIICFIMFLIVRSRIRDKKVKDTSRKIKLLAELNNKTKFNNIQKSINIRKHYDNKRNYTRVEPGYLMTFEIKEKIVSYTKYIEKIEENRNLLAEYKQKVSRILNGHYDNPEINELRISQKEFVRRERRLVKRMILNPTIDIKVDVSMSYSSPQGQVRLSKTGSFNFDDMLAAFGSISRTYLSKETRDKLSSTVRGNLSDSLRFDVLRRDKYRCVICGASSREGARLHVDHIKPVSKGGRSVLKNLQTLCERCNIGKSNKTVTNHIDNKSESNLCPQCGSKLVQRKGKHGNFLGCSSFPNCRFTQKI